MFLTLWLKLWVKTFVMKVLCERICLVNMQVQESCKNWGEKFAFNYIHNNLILLTNYNTTGIFIWFISWIKHFLRNTYKLESDLWLIGFIYKLCQKYIDWALQHLRKIYAFCWCSLWRVTLADFVSISYPFIIH